jgi:RNA polymerase sigma-70 factor (ECF subfamily)
MTAEPKVIALADHQRAQRSDDDLMRLARAGAAGAFETLVRRHQARVLRLCHRYLSDRSLTQDAAQNTFIELYRYLPRYQPRGQFEAFLRRVALNQCRMASRARKRPSPEPSAATADGPDVEVLRAERQREIARALSKLSARHREVIALRFGADLSYQEIAETLRVPIGTVRSRMFAALKKLRRRLGEVR